MEWQRSTFHATFETTDGNPLCSFLSVTEGFRQRSLEAWHQEFGSSRSPPRDDGLRWNSPRPGSMHTTSGPPCVICVTGGRKPGSVYRPKGATNCHDLVSQSAPAQADQTLLPCPASGKEHGFTVGWPARLSTVKEGIDKVLKGESDLV